VIAGVLLAAGASSRMGSDKALVRQKGVSYLAHGVRHLWQACPSVVVVLGANAARVRRQVEAEFEILLASGWLQREVAPTQDEDADGVEMHLVDNPRWRDGMLSSVQVGLRAALALKPEGVLVLPVDHPSVRPETIADVAALMRMSQQACADDAERAKFAYALVPRIKGRRGHPLALTAPLARAVSRDREATDLSDAVRRHARILGFLDVKDPGIVRNVNKPGE